MLTNGKRENAQKWKKKKCVEREQEKMFRTEQERNTENGIKVNPKLNAKKNDRN